MHFLSWTVGGNCNWGKQRISSKHYRGLFFPPSQTEEGPTLQWIRHLLVMVGPQTQDTKNVEIQAFLRKISLPPPHYYCWLLSRYFAKSWVSIFLTLQSKYYCSLGI